MFYGHRLCDYMYHEALKIKKTMKLYVDQEDGCWKIFIETARENLQI